VGGAYRVGRPVVRVGDSRGTDGHDGPSWSPQAQQTRSAITLRGQRRYVGEFSPQLRNVPARSGRTASSSLSSLSNFICPKYHSWHSSCLGYRFLPAGRVETGQAKKRCPPSYFTVHSKALAPRGGGARRAGTGKGLVVVQGLQEREVRRREDWCSEWPIEPVGVPSCRKRSTSDGDFG
jgi:hypothetical protein